MRIVLLSNIMTQKPVPRMEIILTRLQLLTVESDYDQKNFKSYFWDNFVMMTYDSRQIESNRWGNRKKLLAQADVSRDSQVDGFWRRRRLFRLLLERLVIFNSISENFRLALSLFFASKWWTRSWKAWAMTHEISFVSCCFVESKSGLAFYDDELSRRISEMIDGKLVERRSIDESTSRFWLHVATRLTIFCFRRHTFADLCTLSLASVDLCGADIEALHSPLKCCSKITHVAVEHKL